MIRGTAVYGLEASVIRSGFPMVVKSGEAKSDFNRAIKLAGAPAGSGHDCFLKGIIVQADFVMPQYWWQQAKRYHWFDFISSQSTMHRIGSMKLSEACNKHVDPRIIRIAQGYIDDYNDKLCSIDVVLSNIPQGLLLCAGITTNYLQLKTMYAQRKTHRLPEWSDEFTKWVERLPHSELITSGGNTNG